MTLRKRTGYSHLNEDALCCTIWGARFEKGFAYIMKQTDK